MGECWGEEICQLEDVDILKDATAVFTFQVYYNAEDCSAFSSFILI